MHRRRTCFVLATVALTLSGLVVLMVQPAGAAPANRDLKLNEVQIVGTAESYKLAPSSEMLSLIRMGGKKDALALDFSEPPISAQLDAGARTLSFDIVYDPDGGLFKSPAGASMADDLLGKDFTDAMAQPGFKVMHVPDVDFRSSCLTLKACLAQVAGWSAAHPTHIPIVITLHCTDSKTPIPGATHPMPFDAAAAAALDKEVRAAFTAAQLITPDQLKGSHATLREAVQAGVWPTLRAARGKEILVLADDAQKAEPYAAEAGRPMFVTTNEASPNAAFIAIDNPVKDAARITADVKAGFIVITRADDETVEARANDTNRRDWAFASGAQIVQTDFLLADKSIGGYQVNIADRRHAQCDVQDANCAAWNAAPQRTAAAR